MKKISPSLKNDIINSAIIIALETSWEKVRLADIAQALKIDLNTIRYFFSEKDQIIDAYFERADEAMLNAASAPEVCGLTCKEKLLTLMMTWLNTFDGQQSVVRQMISHKLEFGHLHIQLPALKRISQTVQWWREASGLSETLPIRALQETALTAIYLATFAYWLLDDSGREKTRCLLDKELTIAFKLSYFIDSSATLDKHSTN